MKKIGFAAFITFLSINAIFAQGWGNPRSAVQSVTVEGTLQLQNGQIAVSTGNAVYFVPMLGRYVGFIDGIKEGNKVTVEGYASGNYLFPSKVTVDGKSYDFQTPAADPGYGPGLCCGGGFAFGRGGRGRRR